jgi:DNA-binding IclR family transcriptional regulator
VSASAGAVQQEALPPSMVERMTLIMEAFGGPQSRLTLEEVTVSTRLPRSTTHRILEQLVRLGWLDHRGRDYALGQRALGLGGREVGQSALRANAFPLLQELATRTEMVVHLVALEGADVYYLDKLGRSGIVDVPSRVGGRAPAHCTAAGKSMLAWLSPEQVDDLFPRGMCGRTPRSIIDLGVLHQELRRIRTRNGLAFERGECSAQVSCVGAAVRGPDGPIGAISLAGDVHAGLERVAPLVLNAAHAVSRAVGGVSVRPGDGHQDAPYVSPGPALGQLVAMAECGQWF